MHIVLTAPSEMQVYVVDGAWRGERDREKRRWFLRRLAGCRTYLLQGCMYESFLAHPVSFPFLVSCLFPYTQHPLVSWGNSVEIINFPGSEPSLSE